METFCMGCGTPGVWDYCERCEMLAEVGEETVDVVLGGVHRSLYPVVPAAPLPPDCDCNSPAPVKGSNMGKMGDYLECAGCRGKVSRLRIEEDRIPLR